MLSPCAWLGPSTADSSCESRDAVLSWTSREGSHEPSFKSLGPFRVVFNLSSPLELAIALKDRNLKAVKALKSGRGRWNLVPSYEAISLRSAMRHGPQITSINCAAGRLTTG